MISMHPRAAGRRRHAGPAADPAGDAGGAPHVPQPAVRRRSARLLPRHGPRPQVGHRGRRPPAAGRARALGEPARPGGRPDRVGPGAGAAGLRLSHLPRARGHLVPRRRSRRPPRRCSGASTTVAGTRTGTTASSTRSSSAPRPCMRPDTPWASSATVPSAPAIPPGTPPSSPTSATAPPPRATSTRRSSSPAVSNAPVVFFCQNNQYAISEPNERQLRVPPYRRADGFGFPGVRVDGNDVVAVHAVTTAALDRARCGEGPDPDRGLHLPDGRAHHVRRPDPLPARRRARGLDGA